MIGPIPDIAELTLDQILFDTPDPMREVLLTQFLRQRRPVPLRAEGGPVPVRLRGEAYVVDEKPIEVVPEEAIDLLYLYGREGIYRGRDQLTGYSLGTLAALPPEERARVEPNLRIIDGYLTHDKTPDKKRG